VRGARVRIGSEMQRQYRTCGKLNQYLWYKGALLRLNDISSLRRSEKLQLASMELKKVGGAGNVGESR